MEKMKTEALAITVAGLSNAPTAPLYGRRQNIIRQH
jgi:hypothetical protein